VADAVDDAYYAFNDVNAMLAFVGAGRREAQQRQVDTVRRADRGWNQRHDEPRDRRAGVKVWLRSAAATMRKDRTVVAVAGEGQSLRWRPRAARPVFVDDHRSRDPAGRSRPCRCIRGGTAVMET
jgi:hypothetical protein